MVLLFYILNNSLTVSEYCHYQVPPLPDKKMKDCQTVTLEVVDTLKLNTTARIKDKIEMVMFGGDNVVECAPSSGIIVSNVEKVTIQDLTFTGCGAVVKEKYSGNHFFSALSVISGTDISLSNISFYYSVGIGLRIINVRRHADIFGSVFQNGNLLENTQLGGGMYVHQYEKCLNTTPPLVAITVRSCSFVNNRVFYSENLSGCGNDSNSGLGFGGGLNIRLQRYTYHLNITVNSSSFSGNYASSGGGMAVALCFSQYNSIYLNNVSFIQNKAHSQGGGGISIFMVSSENNSISITNTSFTSNEATYGGGVAITARKPSKNGSANKIEMANCILRDNSAYLGSAVDIFPSREVDNWGNLPPLMITSCTFVHNHNCALASNETNLLRDGFGVIMTTGFPIKFGGTNTFFGNSGSCVYATSSKITFSNDATSKFENNSAEYGAGIALIGVSLIKIKSRCHFNFTGNTVRKSGAAIYYYGINKHKYVHPYQDFIQISKKISNTSFYFSNNCAPNDDRYLSGSYTVENIRSLNTKYSEYKFPCQVEILNLRHPQHECDQVLLSAFPSKQCIWNDSYDGIIDTVNFIPGIEQNLSITANPTAFEFCIYKNKMNIAFSNDNTKMMLNSLTLKGPISSNAAIYLRGMTFEGLYSTFNASLTACPPLYKFDSKSMGCRCYHSHELHYSYMHFTCNVTGNSYSSISNDYWIGYDDLTPGDVLLGFCPPGFCNVAHGDDWFMTSLSFYLNESSQQLDKEVCRYRQGILCGQCLPQRAVFYHSPNFECRSTKLCHFGILFFLLSEIIPVSVAFLLLILLRVKLTAGGVTGLIFFAQMYVAIDARLDLFIKHDISKYVTTFNLIVYHLFNLDFFKVNSLAFCLQEKATALDLLVIKYAVSAYALFLALCTVGLVRTCSGYRCFKFQLGQYSLVQVLSTFLVIIYSKCTHVSFNILWYQDLYHEKSHRHTVVALQGNLKYFGPEHRPYAIIALLVMIFLTLLLPVVLLAYPLSNKIVSILKLENSCVILFLSKIFPLFKLLPLFDCFQGAFKEEYRFFAGLHFVYRIAILSALFSRRMNIVYGIIAILLTLIILLHVIFQPYKKKIHNVIDTLLFSNLALVCSLKLLMIVIFRNSSDPMEIHFFRIIEVILVNLPIAAVIFAIFYQRILKKCQLRKRMMSSLGDRDSFLLDGVRDESLSNYQNMYSFKH